MTPVFITGTGTDVGKTWVLARLITELRRRGHTVHARKPAQSFAPAERGHTDAELLAAASGEAPTDVCPVHRWYELPMAPPMAAASLGLPEFTIADLVAETTVTPTCLVEGAGGPRSPLAADGDNIAFARRLGAAHALLVADAGLGTINAVALCSDALTGFETIVMLNRFDPGAELHRRNREWLLDAGYRVAVTVGETADRLETRLP
ncbi:MAG: dethiobiotin synthase [Acidimicrobiia bacterium]|nr:dethiobiotin synthase [Acidimicrobiia bacterium]